MGNLDNIIREAEGLLPVDQFINKCGRDYINKEEWVENPLCDKSKKLEVLAKKIFKTNLPGIYLDNLKIRNLHLGLIHIERQEYNEAFDCFKKIYKTDKDSLYTYTFFSFLASRLQDWQWFIEFTEKHKKGWVVPENLALIADLHPKFESLFPFLKKKNVKLKNLSIRYKHISNSLMKKATKKILKERRDDFVKIFESTNDVYEFSDKLVSPFFIIKKYGRKEGFILEKKLINYYKRYKDLSLPKIIYESNKENIIVFLREAYKTDFLTELENIYGSQKLKPELREKKFEQFREEFGKLMTALANIHANTPNNILKGNEKNEKNYQKDLDSFCEVVNTITKGKLESISSQFKEDYACIIKRLAKAKKVIYKDAYLRNALIPSRLHSEIQLIDFEKSCLAPAQLDLVQVLDFGNFLNDKHKEELMDTYLYTFNVLVENPRNFYNPSKIVKDKKEFKKIFDYACVHRNIMHFRSQSKLLGQGDNSPQTKLYRKASLRNSIKALDKILDYENKRVVEIRVRAHWRGETLVKYYSRKNLCMPLRKYELWDKKRLKRIKSYLESVYRELYQ